jgi:uncharacterized protein (TIGR03083 family)
MTTPAYSELVTAVRREGEGLLTAAGLGIDVDVPACADWTLEDLVRHVWQVYANVTLYVSTRATSRPDPLPTMPAGDPVERLREQLDDLVAALTECEADTPIWTWVRNQPEGAIFWARRMAHESSVHRFDAQDAHGVRQPIDAELASDGIDELIDVIVPRVYSRDQVAGPTGTVQLESSDGGAWSLVLEPSGVSRGDPVRDPQVRVRGTSNALLLGCYSRIPWPSLDVTGDTDLLTAWTGALNF